MLINDQTYKLRFSTDSLDKVLGIVARGVWYVLHGSYIPLFLLSNCTVTLTFDLEGQGHILFPMTVHGVTPDKFNSRTNFTYCDFSALNLDDQGRICST